MMMMSQTGVLKILKSLEKATIEINKTKDWAIVQNAALVGVEVSLG